MEPTARSHRPGRDDADSLRDRLAAAEQALAESRRREEVLHALLADGPDAFMRLDLAPASDGGDRRAVIAEWNDAAERLYGYTRAEIVGQPMSLLIPPERRDELSRVIARLVDGGPIDEYETVRLRKDGTRIDVSVSVARVRDADGRTVGASGVVRDISGRKSAEQQARVRASLLDQVRSAVIATDLDRRIIHWNRYAETLYQWKAEEVLGRTDIEINVPEPGLDRSHEILAEVAQTGRWEGEFTVRRKDGMHFPAHVVVAGLRDAEGRLTGFVGVSNDNTERKRTEAERERLHREVVQSRQLLEVLSRRLLEAQETERRHLAHELHDEIGQVLTVVNLNLESLRARVDRAAWPRLDESVEVVNRAIEQVRDLSLDLRPAALDLLGLESALRSHVTRQAARGGLALAFVSTLNGRRPPPALETVCFRVVQEALTNVLRHARASRCRVELAMTDDSLDVCITDDGVGFDVAAARERALRGDGYGLLSMLERVQLVAARIRIDAAPGRGTTIEVRFPIRRSPEGRTP
jgi:PAS domain S-box-containing protein